MTAESCSDSEGVGDTIAKAIRAVTRGRVRPCGGCERRRKALNRAVPYRRKPKCPGCQERGEASDAEVTRANA